MIFRSPHPDVSIPVVPFPDYVLRRAGELGDKPALIDGASGTAISFRELQDRCRAAASGLAARGLAKGDVVAICSPNVPEWAVAFNGVSLAGGVTTTLSPLSTAKEIAGQVNDSGARFLITVPALIDKALDAVSMSCLEEVFVFGQVGGATPFDSLLQQGGQPPSVAIDPWEDLVALPYSSGTTGVPKGVMLTHHNLVSNIVQMLTVDPLSDDDIALAVVPFFHIYGLVVVLGTLLAEGVTIVCMPRFDLEEFLQLLETYRVTRANLVPPIILALAKHELVDRFDLSSMRLIISGAAPLGEDVSSACAERVGCEVRQGYGLTETSPVTHYCGPRSPAGNKPGTVGPAVPNTEVCLVDITTGERRGPGEKGEVWMRGPQVMKGYLNRPDATAETVDQDGWLHSGDVGIIDQDGYLSVVDRAKELIKYKGFQVAPAELENLLLAHPAVADVAVIPSPDDEAGEVPKAFVVTRSDLTEEEILQWVAEQVAPHKRVRLVEFTDEIPKSAAGKILRRLLVERERARVGKKV
jgi:acyl-CoA synthetase (AMP-forming)/AMP-acid ligase II